MAKRIWATIIGALVYTLVSESTFSQDVQTTMLPRSTVAAFSILDGKAWQARWKTTGLAKFFENRAVKKYLNDVTSSASSEAAWLRLILPGDDPVAVAGQLTYALISTSNRYEHLLQIECDDAATATNWISTMSWRLKEQQYSLQNASDGIQVFKSSSGKSVVAFTSQGNRGFACTNPAVLDQLLSKNFQPLVGSREFESTVTKARTEFGQPMFWWFARPFELTRGDASDEDAIKNYNLMKSQGFDAFNAIGGAGSVDEKTQRVRSVGFAAVAGPLRQAARMLDLNNSPLPAIPQWCKAATSCGFANIQLNRFLENYSTLFDAMYGEGETGVFVAVLDDLRQRNDGPKVDVQSELFSLLQSPVYFATVQGEASAPRIIAVKSNQPDRVAATVTRLFQGDSRAVNQSGAGHVTWKVNPIEDGYGIKEPFVISVRDGILFVAPNSGVIDYLMKQSGSIGAFESEQGNASFGYRVDFDKLFGRFWVQLKSGKLSPSADSLLTRMNLKKAVLSADPGKLPDYETVKQSFDSVLSIVGSGKGGDWKLFINSK